MWRAVSICLLCGPVMGCVGTERVNTFHAVCLPLKEYTTAQQQEAATELSRMPKDAEVPKMIVDYGELRSADRECLKHQ